MTEHDFYQFCDCFWRYKKIRVQKYIFQGSGPPFHSPKRIQQKTIDIRIDECLCEGVKRYMKLV